MQGLHRGFNRGYDASLDGDLLVLSRRRAGYLLTLAGAAATSAADLLLCFSRSPNPAAAHTMLLTAVHIMGFCLLPVCLLFLAASLSVLRSRAWDFDRRSGLILLDGSPVCRVEEVQSVHLDRSYYNSEFKALYLRTKARTNILLASEGVVGVGLREMREKGALISSHLGVALVLPDAYIME